MKTQPLWKTLHQPTREAWEKNNLPKEQTLEKIRASQLRIGCCGVVSLLIVFVGGWLMLSNLFEPRQSYTAFICIGGLVLFTYGVSTMIWALNRVNVLLSQLTRFEKDAKELGLWNCSPLQDPSYPVRQKLILAAMNFLVAKIPFNLNMKMTYKEAYKKGKFAKECKEEYKRLLTLAVSFGLATGNWDEHFVPAQEWLDTARE